jgi:hypothetical protein
VALAIEMGYEIYTKPYSDWLTPRLKKRVIPQTIWTRVGGNAEMIAWKAERFSDFPYPSMSPWSASTPARPNGMAPSSTLAAIRSPPICPAGFSATTLAN